MIIDFSDCPEQTLADDEQKIKSRLLDQAADLGPFATVFLQSLWTESILGTAEHAGRLFRLAHYYDPWRSAKFPPLCSDKLPLSPARYCSGCVKEVTGSMGRNSETGRGECEEWPARLAFLGRYRTLCLDGSLLAGGVNDVLRSDADAVLHVENSAVDGDAVQECGGEVRVLKE